jgi:hypothetical protein
MTADWFVIVNGQWSAGCNSQIVRMESGYDYQPVTVSPVANGQLSTGNSGCVVNYLMTDEPIRWRRESNIRHLTVDN